MAGDIELQGLLEKQAVLEAVTRLFVATDDRDWAAVEACFANELLFDMSSMGAGPAARVSARSVVEGWREGLRPLQAIHHQTGNHLIEVRDSRATVSCYGIAFHYLPNPTGRNTRTFVGSYDIELERRGGAWRITAFRFNLKYREGNLELETGG